MALRSCSTLALVMLLGACAAKNHRAGDVLATTKPGATVVYATTECTAPNSDGVRCNKKTCKQDKVSDCSEFASGCLEYGNYYQGSKDGGTCSRVV